MSDSYDDYRGDAFYEAWRRGVDVDRLDDDRIHDYYDEGSLPEQYPIDIKRRDECERERRELERAEMEYYRELEGNDGKDGL